MIAYAKKELNSQQLVVERTPPALEAPKSPRWVNLLLDLYFFLEAFFRIKICRNLKTN